MTPDEAALLLQKYLDGNTSEEETALVEEWYGMLSSNQNISQERKSIVAENMRSHIRDAIQVHWRRNPALLYNIWFRLAAMLLVLVSVGLIFLNLHHSASSELTVTTKANERKEVTLPDGSKVTMEALSEISYPVHFSSATRVMKLMKGDAFFAIQHDEKRPFRVQLQSKMEIRVLGTSFRIRDVKQDDLLKITVATGKVEICKDALAIDTLIKGEEMAFHKKLGQASVYPSNAPNIVELSFNGSSLQEVIRKLEYVYSISIQVSDPKLLKLKSTAHFNSSQTADEILEILCSLHHLKLNTSNNHRTFKIHK
ncbi:FecR family protein [Pedobacter frigidisoli]|uniref:FecR family protein n=1 Tax=Pedobacter frigidisoli TaxID=2530455 RepID=UPI00292EF7F9|nr:FecR domain-containing protein [Pedobacter frigidisoli]